MSRFFDYNIYAQYIAKSNIKYTLCSIFNFTPILISVIKVKEAKEDENKKHLYSRF